jgi:hypothetical protein
MRLLLRRSGAISSISTRDNIGQLLQLYRCTACLVVAINNLLLTSFLSDMVEVVSVQPTYFPTIIPPNFHKLLKEILFLYLNLNYKLPFASITPP